MTPRRRPASRGQQLPASPLPSASGGQPPARCSPTQIGRWQSQWQRPSARQLALAPAAEAATAPCTRRLTPPCSPPDRARGNVPLPLSVPRSLRQWSFPFWPASAFPRPLPSEWATWAPMAPRCCAPRIVCIRVISSRLLAAVSRRHCPKVEGVLFDQISQQHFCQALARSRKQPASCDGNAQDPARATNEQLTCTLLLG